MNTARTLIASSLFSVVTLLAATGAVAQEVTPTGFEQFSSVASRADVRADAASALRWMDTNSAMPVAARFNSASSSARAKAMPSAVPCTSTKPPEPVITTFMSVSQSESSG